MPFNRLQILLFIACLHSLSWNDSAINRVHAQEVTVVILGNAQDAGFPQANCRKDCCKRAWQTPSDRRFATCIAILDAKAGKRFLFECTPHFPDQLHLLNRISTEQGLPTETLDGIFLTHAHIGHYAGLVHLGREVMGTKSVPVHVMPRMRKFLISNGPWSQLVQLKNITLHKLLDRTEKQMGNIRVTPILVPHRDEFSETVGFRVQGPNRSLLFLPDIDKWEKWNLNINKEIAKVDIALVDGTFFGEGELPGRNMKEIPHPFIQESLQRFEDLPGSEKEKIHFIHFNHTNPVLQNGSSARKKILDAGFRIARQAQTIRL